MANFKISDQRMIDLIYILKYQGEIRFATEFCAVAGILKQNIRSVLVGPASFTGVHIGNVCKKFGVNANWVFDIEPNVFRGRKNTEALDKFISDLKNIERPPLIEPKIRKKKGDPVPIKKPSSEPEVRQKEAIVKK